MKRIIVLTILSVMVAPWAWGQSAPTGQKTLAATMDVFVFPTEGQDSGQQSKDEAECYTWAVQNTGSDPFELQAKNEQAQQQAEQTKQQTAQATQGAGATAAVKGAAAGALIGEIANDDAGKGAAYGAAAGLVAGRRRSRSANKQAEQQADQQVAQSQQVTAEGITNFKKAFSVCLEAKKYMVKY
jgi:hypothetical protein